MRKISVKQKELLEAIEWYISQKKYPPTIKELCELVGNKSCSSVFYKLMSLEEKGYIKTTNGRNRAIKILKKVDE